MLTCDWCISIHFVCFYVFAACDRPVSDCFRQWSTSFFRSFLWCFLFLSLARITHQSIPPAPTPPPPPAQATAGHLPALLVPGVGHLPTQGPFPSFWHWKKMQIGSSVKYRNKLKRVVKACFRFYACISSLLIKPKLHSEIGAIDVNRGFLVIEWNFCWYYLKNILSYL